MRAPRSAGGITVSVLALAVCGCRSHAPVESTAQFSQALGDHLIDGRTTKTDVVLSYGTPAATFQNETILTYHMARGDRSTLKVVRPRADPHERPLAVWDKGNFDLILVFDRNDILQHHSLIKVF